MPKRRDNVVGWRERVSLPELGIEDMGAKIDTGARTSALHAEELEVFTRDRSDWIRFRTPIALRGAERPIELPLLDQRDIKNTSGIPQTRPVVRLLVILGWHRWHIEVSLTDRKNMEFDLILGRTALRGRKMLVDPGRSHLLGLPRAAHPERKPKSAPEGSSASHQGEEE